MTCYIFVGPTLRSVDRPSYPDTVYLPPVEQGNVYALVKKKPRAIGIIDGRFQDVPAVWHKEILYALSQGIPVYGSSSMGALRAAELSVFGMRGSGWIYESYCSGALEDDDEVAISHASEEDGFIPTSDALVNIRRTLVACRDSGRIANSTHDALIDRIKDEFYANRSFQLVLRLGKNLGIPDGELDRLTAWLNTNRIDQKKIDAIEMLELIHQNLNSGGISNASFEFERTVFFDRACHESPGADASGLLRPSLDELIGELRLNPPLYREVSERAAERMRGLRGTSMLELIVDQLRMQGLYSSLAEHFTKKHAFLKSVGLGDSAAGLQSDISDDELLNWYFREHLGGKASGFEQNLEMADFRSRVLFIKEVRREYWYRTMSQ